MQKEFEGQVPDQFGLRKDFEYVDVQVEILGFEMYAWISINAKFEKYTPITS